MQDKFVHDFDVDVSISLLNWVADKRKNTFFVIYLAYVVEWNFYFTWM